MSALNTNTVHEVLKAWVHDKLIEVPAVHKDGQYLIEYDKIVEHIEGLEYNDLGEILLEAEANYFGA